MNNKTNYNQLYNNFSPKIYSKTQPFSFFNQNNQSQSSNNKISYNPNIISNQNFIPNTKNTIKWRNINKINLTHLKNSRDINILQSYLDNLITGLISEEDIQTIQENNIVKLIQILQTTSDILLNEQAELENEKLKLESDNLRIMKDFQEKDRLNIKNKEKIHRLKKDKRREIGVINTYINVINNLKHGTHFSQENYNITDIEINQKNINDTNAINNYLKKEKELDKFKCQFCPDKTFTTEFELTKHLEEFHGIKKPSQMYPEQNIPQYQMQVIKPEVTIKIPDNLYRINNTNNNQDIKNEEIIKEMKNMQQEFMRKIKEQQEEIENTRRMQPNYINTDLNKLEKTFKETIDNFKSMVQEKKNENNNVFIEESENDDEEEQKKLQELKLLKDQLENEKRNLDKKKYEFDLEEQKFNSIFLEINQTKKFIEDDYAKNNINNTSFSYNMQIQTRPVNLEILTDKNKIHDKKYFNSGIIQPDHDETDEEIQKRKAELEEIQNYKKEYQEFFNTIHQQQLKKDTKIIEKEEEIKIETKTEKNNDIIELEETNNFILDKKEKEKENKINLLNQKKTNKELEKYYNKYMKRDKMFLKNNKFNDYLIETLPSNFKLDDNLNINELVGDKTKETALEIFPKNLNLNLQLDEKDIKEQNINDLLNITDNLINDIDGKNGGDIFINDYYKSIMKTLGFKNIKKTTKKIKDKSRIEKVIQEKEEKKEENINGKDNKDEENKLLTSNTVVNSFANTKIIKEKEKEGENIDNKDNKKEIAGELIMTDIIIDDINKKNEEDKLKKPQPNENNHIDNKIINNNIEKLQDINPDNQITNFKPNISEPIKKSEEIVIQTTNLQQEGKINLNRPDTSAMPNNKDEKDNNLDLPYTSTITNTQNIINNERLDKNLDAPYTSTKTGPQNKINIGEKDKDKHLDAPYTSTITNTQNNINISEKDKDKHLDAPYTSTITNTQNNINNERKDKHLDAPYTSTTINLENGKEKNQNNQHWDAPFSSSQANNNILQKNIINNNPIIKDDDLPISRNINYNDDKSLDMTYTSNIAILPENKNPTQNTNMVNNNVNNKNLVNNLEKGPSLNNNINEKNKIPDMSYTSTMANNIPPQNDHIIQGKTGFSEKQDIYNQEIKPQTNQSSKMKESELVLEKNENEEIKVNDNNIKNNNNNTTIKDSVMTTGAQNNESMEFDIMMGKKNALKK